MAGASPGPWGCARAAVALSLALAASASAQDPALGLRRFGLDGGGRDALAVGTGTVGPEGQVRVFVASELERAPFVLLASGRIEGGAGGGAGATLDRWITHVRFTGVVVPRRGGGTP